VRYFTPELYLKLQSSDEKTLHAGAQGWERAIEAYARHLEKIRAQLPPEVLAFGQSNFHDWRLLMFWPDAYGEAPANGLIMLLQHRKDIAVLSYSLTTLVERIDPPREWDMPLDRVYWLYDELDLGARGTKSFTHRILLTDGTTLLINFSSCRVNKTNLDRGVTHEDLASLVASLIKTA